MRTQGRILSSTQIIFCLNTRAGISSANYFYPNIALSNESNCICSRNSQALFAPWTPRGAIPKSHEPIIFFQSIAIPKWNQPAYAVEYLSVVCSPDARMQCPEVWYPVHFFTATYQIKPDCKCSLELSIVCSPDAQRWCPLLLQRFHNKLQNPESHEPIPVMIWPKNCIHSSMPSSVCYPDTQSQNPESRQPIPVMNWPDNCICSSMPSSVWSPGTQRQNSKSHEPNWPEKLHTQLTEQCVLAARPEAKSWIPWTDPRSELTRNSIHNLMPSSVCSPDAQRRNPNSCVPIPVWLDLKLFTEKCVLTGRQRRHPESHERIPIMNWPEKLYTQFNAESMFAPRTPRGKVLNSANTKILEQFFRAIHPSLDLASCSH